MVISGTGIQPKKCIPCIHPAWFTPPALFECLLASCMVEGLTTGWHFCVCCWEKSISFVGGSSCCVCRRDVYNIDNNNFSKIHLKNRQLETGINSLYIFKKSEN